MNENRPTLRHMTMTAQNTGGKKNILQLSRGGGQITDGIRGIMTSVAAPEARSQWSSCVQHYEQKLFLTQANY